MKGKERLEELYERLNSLLKDLKEEDIKVFLQSIMSNEGIPEENKKKILEDLHNLTVSFDNLASFIEKNYGTEPKKH